MSVHLFVEGSNTDGSEFTDASEKGGSAPGRSWTMLSPANARTRPAGKTVGAGDHRPTDMSGSRVYEFAFESKIVVSARPLSPPMFPPTMRVRPSASCTWPEQNRLRPY